MFDFATAALTLSESVEVGPVLADLERDFFRRIEVRALVRQKIASIARGAIRPRHIFRDEQCAT